MKTTTNRGLAIMAVALFAAGVTVAANFVLNWTGHTVNFRVPEPAGLALAGLGLIGLSQTLVRRFGKV